MSTEERRREDRVRREAERLGLQVRKQRRGQDAGRYLLLNEHGNGLSSHNRTWPHSFDLGEVEGFLASRT